MDDGTAAELSDEDEVSGNTKTAGGLVVGVIVGLTVSAGGIVFQKMADRTEERDTGKQVAALTAIVTGIQSDVRDIKSAGYVTRSEWEREFSRVDHRLTDLEQRRK